MRSGVIVWLVIFTVSTIVFFVIAAVVVVKGFSDLRSLLRFTSPGTDGEPKSTVQDIER